VSFSPGLPVKTLLPGVGENSSDQTNNQNEFNKEALILKELAS
jgi:hypothetical protein